MPWIAAALDGEVMVDAPSLLFAPGTRPRRGVARPDAVTDLHLDRIRDAVLTEGAGHGLGTVFEDWLPDAEAVVYRHDIFRDLDRAAAGAAVTAFAEHMHEVRDHLTRAGVVHDSRQRDRWHLDAAEIYCRAVELLRDGLSAAEVRSTALRGLHAYLTEYTGSARFRQLTDDAHAITTQSAANRYGVHIDGWQVRVERYAGQPDLTAAVASEFARFAPESADRHPTTVPPPSDLNHIDEQILDCVARLFPDLFRRLAEFRRVHDDFVDEPVAVFDREVRFYLAYRRFMRRFTDAGLSFCYPEVCAEFDEIHAVAAFEPVLAAALIERQEAVVCNDFRLTEPEHILVVTGPNNGGKTTFARMFGQLAYLAALGCPVPGTSARLMLPDQLFTHFERQEHVSTLQGKLDAELLRIRDVLTATTSSTIVVMNESFSSTTAADAALIGADVLRAIGKRGAIAVFVTFLDELADLDDTTVSMVGEMSPADPIGRTFRFARKAADGLAYAQAIAGRYGLTYDAIRRSVIR